MSTIIGQTIALLTQAIDCDTARMPADSRGEFLQASTELRDAVLRLANLDEGQQIKRNLAETRAVLALLRENGTLAGEIFEHIHACAEHIVEGCALAAKQTAAG